MTPEGFNSGYQPDDKCDGQQTCLSDDLAYSTSMNVAGASGISRSVW